MLEHVCTLCSVTLATKREPQKCIAHGDKGKPEHMVREPLLPQHPHTIANCRKGESPSDCLEYDHTDPASKTGVARANICALELRLSLTIPEGDSSTVDLK